MKRCAMMVAGMLVAVTLPAAAQDVAEMIRQAVEAQLARDPATAMGHLEAALAAEPQNYEANWRAAENLMDIGKQTPDSVKSPERDSIYARAERVARVAVEANPNGPEGYYVLSAAIGRASLTKSSKERVRRAAEIRSAGLKAIELDSLNHKAYHVMGRWNAEIMRLSGFTRFFAKTFLGGKIFNAASWDSATVYMTKAVAISPENIYHRLDLAEILIDRDRYSEARAELTRVEELPIYDVMDPTYKLRAASLLRKIKDKKDKS
ncbi:MAG TPA: tetratricopeptide repeat protein [Gemmatimonadales bacterium]|nr:tetratricopeptide repeat protein [Gemmatimonadales bacterium]